MKFKKIDVSFEEGSRIKAENRAAKIALLAAMTAEDRELFNARNEARFAEIAKGFEGYYVKFEGSYIKM